MVTPVDLWRGALWGLATGRAGQRDSGQRDLPGGGGALRWSVAVRASTRARSRPGGSGAFIQIVEQIDEKDPTASVYYRDLLEFRKKYPKLNILLQEDLTIRGGAQLWLMNCGR